MSAFVVASKMLQGWGESSLSSARECNQQNLQRHHSAWFMSRFKSSVDRMTQRGTHDPVSYDGIGWGQGARMRAQANLIQKEHKALLATTCSAIMFRQEGRHIHAYSPDDITWYLAALLPPRSLLHDLKAFIRTASFAMISNIIPWLPLFGDLGLVRRDHCLPTNAWI